MVMLQKMMDTTPRISSSVGCFWKVAEKTYSGEVVMSPNITPKDT